MEWPLFGEAAAELALEAASVWNCTLPNHVYSQIMKPSSFDMTCMFSLPCTNDLFASLHFAQLFIKHP
jgi:hypothetical protein